MSANQSIDDLFDELRRSGWRLQENASASGWQVAGTRQGITFRSHGVSQEEAWRRAWQQAQALAGHPPAGDPDAPSQRSWSRTVWEAIVIVPVLTLGAFVLGTFSDGLECGVSLAMIAFPAVTAAFAVHLLLARWAGGRSRWSWLGRLKAVVRYLLTDR
jgi:hypothetical protein